MHAYVLRRRFLVAMGLAISACSKERVPADAAVPSATPNATPSATPSATASATPSATPFPLGKTGGGGCGFDVKCVSFPRGTKKCAATLADDDKDNPRTGDLAPEEDKQFFSEKGDCCYRFPRTHCGGGRPLRGDDGPIVATHVRRSDWLAELDAAPAERDDELAARWLREASFEHASVASFARASLQLLALGAPPELIVDTHRAALDEIAHARAFHSLAKRRGAGEQGPGPLAVDRAPFDVTLATFVVDTFLDGCLAETISGIEIRDRADDGDDVERRAVAAIADDEERHAELAWRMLAWSVRAGGGTARDALEDAIAGVDASEPLVRDIVLPCARALLAAPAVIGAKVSPHGDRSEPAGT